MEQLSQPDREIFDLAVRPGFNAQEIADILAINATAVHMRAQPCPAAPAERLTARE